MKRNCFKKIMVGALSLFIALSGAACGSSESSSEIKFWYFGTDEEKLMYSSMVDEFNATKGKELGFIVEDLPRPASDYETAIERSGLTRSGPDVFLVSDRKYKEWTALGFLTNLDAYMETEDALLSGMWQKTIDVLRYSPTDKTSNNDDSLWGLPVDTSPTAIFYNEDALKAAGVTVISVDEDRLDAWNKNEVRDGYGKYKSDYGITADIPAKGFYRSEWPYQGPGSSWVRPQTGELLVFNNRIAMNWDELEDLAALTTKSYNGASTTQYGYYSTYWFNYGWSVGGDCIEALGENTDWTFTLGDDSANYIVLSADGYEGRYSGKIYQQGETLELKDKFDLAPTDTLSADDNGGYYKNGDTSDTAKISADVLAAVQNGTLGEMPSTKEAFSRWANLRLTREDGGIAVTPFTTSFPQPATDQAINYFIAGNLAMVLEEASNLSEIAANANFSWNAAPLPIYKTYTDPSDPGCDTVEIRGKQAGHFGVYSLAIRERSVNKEHAYEFIKWMAGEEGQSLRADSGYIPNQKALAQNSVSFLSKAQNISVFLESMDYLTTGDWAYLADRTWIDTWANDINGKLQQGKMTLNEYFATGIIAETNKILKDY